MKVKTADLIGPALDWAVAKCEGYTDLRKNCHAFSDELIMTPPRAEYGAVALADLAISWDQCGPIIEQERLEVSPTFSNTAWVAGYPNNPTSKQYWSNGPTPLISVCRCFVASRLGDEVEIPDELV